MIFLDRIITAMDKVAVPKVNQVVKKIGPKVKKEISSDVFADSDASIELPPPASVQLRCPNKQCLSRAGEYDESGNPYEEGKKPNKKSFLVNPVIQGEHYVCSTCGVPIWKAKPIICHNKHVGRYGNDKPRITPIWNKNTKRFECPECGAAQLEALPPGVEPTLKDETKPEMKRSICPHCDQEADIPWVDKKTTNEYKNMSGKTSKPLKEVNVSRWVRQCPNPECKKILPDSLVAKNKRTFQSKTGTNANVENYNLLMAMFAKKTGVDVDTLKRTFPLMTPDISTLQYKITHGRPITVYVGGKKETYDRLTYLNRILKKVNAQEDKMVDIIDKHTGETRQIKKKVDTGDQYYIYENKPIAINTGEKPRVLTSAEFAKYEAERDGIKNVRKLSYRAQYLRVSGPIRVRVRQIQRQPGDDYGVEFFKACKNIVNIDNNIRDLLKLVQDTTVKTTSKKVQKQIDGLNTERDKALAILRSLSDYQSLYQHIKTTTKASPDMVERAVILAGDGGDLSSVFYGTSGYSMGNGYIASQFTQNIDHQFRIPQRFHPNACDRGDEATGDRGDPIALDPAIIARIDVLQLGVISGLINNKDLVSEDILTRAEAKKKLAQVLGKMVFKRLNDTKDIGASTTDGVEQYLKKFYLMQKNNLLSGVPQERPHRPQEESNFQDTVPENVRRVTERVKGPDLSPFFARILGTHDVSTMKGLDKWYMSHGEVQRETYSQYMQRTDPEFYAEYANAYSHEDIAALDIIEDAKQLGAILRDNDGCPLFKTNSDGSPMITANFAVLEGPYEMKVPNSGEGKHDAVWDQTYHRAEPFQFIVATDAFRPAQGYTYDVRVHGHHPAYDSNNKNREFAAVAFSEPSYYPIFDLSPAEASAIQEDQEERANLLYDMARQAEASGNLEAAEKYDKAAYRLRSHRKRTRDYSMELKFEVTPWADTDCDEKIEDEILGVGRSIARNATEYVTNTYIQRKTSNMVRDDLMPLDTPITETQPIKPRSLDDLDARLAQYGLSVDDMSMVIPDKDRPKLSLKDGSYNKFHEDMTAIANGMKAREFAATANIVLNMEGVSAADNAKLVDNYVRAQEEIKIGQYVAGKYNDQLLDTFLETLAGMLHDSGHSLSDIDTATGHAGSVLDPETAAVYYDAQRALNSIAYHKNNIEDTLAVRDVLNTITLPDADGKRHNTGVYTSFHKPEIHGMLVEHYQYMGVTFVPTNPGYFRTIIDKYGCPDGDHVQYVMDILPEDCVSDPQDYKKLMKLNEWVKIMFSKLWEAGMQQNKETGDYSLIHEEHWMKLKDFAEIIEKQTSYEQSRVPDPNSHVITDVMMFEVRDIIEEMGTASIRDLLRRPEFQAPDAADKLGSTIKELLNQDMIAVVDQQPNSLDTTYSVIDPLEIEDMTPQEAYHYAVDAIRSNDPHRKTNYGSDTLRSIACRDAQSAWQYARDVDQGPRDDTRKAACTNPLIAYSYAKDPDKGPHPDTWAACKNDARLKAEYLKNVPGAMAQYGDDADPDNPGPGRTAQLTTRCLLTTRR